MNTEDLAYKLTSDTLKHYTISDLEEKYKLKGGKLVVAIYQEILNEIQPPVIILGEDDIED